MAQDKEHQSRVEFVRELRGLLDRRKHTQTNTTVAFLRLGLRESALSSGEFAVISNLVGQMLGGLVAAGAGIGEAAEFVVSNRWPTAASVIPERRDQLIRIRSFTIQELAFLCSDGGLPPSDDRANPIIEYLVDILCTSFAAATAG